MDAITQALNEQNKVAMAADLFNNSDPTLSVKVENLKYVMNKDERWRTFAFKRGLQSGQIEEILSKAAISQKPAYLILPAIARAKGYTRDAFLSDLKNLGVSSVTEAVGEIETLIASKESKKTQANKTQHDMNSFLRKWIEDNSLCDSPEDTQNRIDDLLRYKVTTKERLKKMTRDGFEKCGFEGMDADMAVDALKNI